MKQKASPLDQAIERFVVDFAAIIQGQVELAVERAFDLQGVARSPSGRRGRKPRAEREPVDVDTETSAATGADSEAPDQSAELTEADQASPADLREAEPKPASSKRGRGAKQAAKRRGTTKQKAEAPEAPKRGGKAKKQSAEAPEAPKRGKVKKQSAEAPAKSRKGKAGRKRAEQLTLF
jgi:hypothetical protein